MKAAVCYEYGQPLVVEEVTLDPPQRDEVRVRLAAAAICHSDLHLLRGDWGGSLPVIAGHEAAGTVVDVGEGVNTLRRGERVVVSLLRSCGRCAYCATGAPTQCIGSFALDRESRLRTGDGTPIRQGINTAAFAEEVVVHHSQVASIPDDMPWPQAALLACGVLTGVGAVVNTARVTPGSSVVVVGAGGVGLNAIQAAALAGATPIIAVDRLESKLDVARDFGATHALTVADEKALASAVAELTGGYGADYVFVTVGSVQAISSAFRLARPRGTVVVVGLPELRARAELPVYFHVMDEKRVVGSFMGSSRLGVDVPRLTHLYRQGLLELDRLITAKYPLERINEALSASAKDQALRNVILFEPPDDTETQDD